MKAAVDLTGYAVHTRYPGLNGTVTAEEYGEALTVARCVYGWVREMLNNP